MYLCEMAGEKTNIRSLPVLHLCDIIITEETRVSCRVRVTLRHDNSGPAHARCNHTRAARRTAATALSYRTAQDRLPALLAGGELKDSWCGYD